MYYTNNKYWRDLTGDPVDRQIALSALYAAQQQIMLRCNKTMVLAR